MDALPGREGGTWFGVSSKFAKIGALLNITQPVLDTSKRPRGHLVTDYLQSDLDAAAYVETVSLQRSEFNPFNLVLLERRCVQLLQCVILVVCRLKCHADVHIDACVLR